MSTSETQLNLTVKALTLALRKVVRDSGLAGFGSRGEKEVWFQDAESALTKHGRKDLIAEHDDAKDAEIMRLRALLGEMVDKTGPYFASERWADELYDRARKASKGEI